ncbi:hypothetical protein DVK85_08295 [Flavobacterium arcticum]|uniref:Uncharacterized protein n=1 Tax=Flavobacterium arcticum TaxID=1784713 RepID=A0A345HCC8_9FLAO|nr:hypothetical protein [Flavobacterium arcticum]AXG74238.1 hypothetical protein DVK85_08295 [Flavobacterium arcticum]KAF2508175.1 hypothetical protein E0W72_11005 [Flavobacterium arcticum]
MEQNKIEQEFKNKLAKRTVQPSAQVWDRLDAMLTVAEEKKPKRKKRTWLYMAASFIVFFTIGVFLLQQEKETNDGVIIEDAVVTTTTEPNIENGALQSTEITEPNVEVGNVVNNNIIKQQKSIATITQPASRIEKKSIYNTNQNNIAGKEEPETAATAYKAPEAALASNVTTDKVVMKKAKKGITINPDELLASVEKSNNKSSITPKKNKSSITIDSNSLLSSVEGELNESFRSKVLQSAVKNYNAIKTSVANRNYQQNQ